jgi:hypothetical protein
MAATAALPPMLGRPRDALWLWAPLPALTLALAFVPERDAPPFAGSLLALNFLHLAATWTRLYDGPARARRSAYVLPIVLLIACAAVARAGYADTLLLLVFLCNLPHIGLQNYGFVRIASRRAGEPDGAARLDWLYCVGVPTWLAARFAARPNVNLFGEGDRLLQALPAALWTVSGACVAGIALAVWVRIARRALAGRPLPPEVVALHACFGPGTALALALLPPPLAPLPLAATHYLQYLVIVRRWHVRADAALPVGARGWGRVPWPVYLVGLALLAPGIPALVDVLLSDTLGGAMVAFGAAASLHHFHVDGRLWRLREPETGRVLVS